VDHFFLIERHLTPMLDIVVSLGDELANAVPLGEPVGRDRAAEFTASGTVEQLRGPYADYGATPIAGSARGAMLHVLEELAQHHGHLEIIRDRLRRPTCQTVVLL
jgi:hypothetical protein